jgi:hypothetical protein
MFFPGGEMSRPFAVGFNEHASICDCPKCTPLRLTAFKKWFEEQSKLPAMPSKDQTVFVRPHWRRQPNHLKKMPHFKKALISTFYGR